MADRTIDAKIAHFEQGQWRPYRHPDMWAAAEAPGSLILGTAQPYQLFEALVAQLEPALMLTVVLHSPRGGAEPGRYRASGLSTEQVLAWCHRFREALERDARLDVWIASENGKVVGLDKHDFVFASGFAPEDIPGFARLRPATATLPFPHTHHYLNSLDARECELFSDFDFERGPLEPGDGD